MELAVHDPAGRPLGSPAPRGLITPAEVAAQPHLVLVEVDEDPAAYHFSHPAGALFVDWQERVRALLSAAPAGTHAFEGLMSSLGITPEDDVVLYGDADNRYAASLLWMMRHHGHERLRLMDGGRPRWVAEGRPMVEDETVRTSTRYRAGAPDHSVRATRDDLASYVGGTAGTLVDCRAYTEYTGRATPAGMRVDPGTVRGHMPGAVNLPLTRLVAPDGGLLAPKELVSRAAEYGLHPRLDLIAYCHRSERSSLTWFALHEVLGYPHMRVYDGGWQEYGNLVGAAVARS